MSHLLFAIAKWLENTSWATAVAESGLGYPLVQATHFIGLSFWVGTSVALDLRLLGLGKKVETAAQLSENLFVWNWIGFSVAIVGGFLLFSSSATTFLFNPAFRLKLGILIPIALLWHIVVQRKAHAWGKSSEVPGLGKLAGLIELLLWVAVVTAAVSIPYY